MPPARPTLDLLRSMSDRLVIQSLGTDGAASRSTLATRTSLSKPTVGQSVARLVEAGVLVEGGAPRVDGARGRAGTVVDFAPRAGAAVAIHAGPDGLVGELLTADGVVRACEEVALTARDAPVTARQLRGGLGTLARTLRSRTPARVRAVAVSVANPVDRSGRTVVLPVSPYLAGTLDVRAALQDLRVTPRVDNDVHWAALAEREIGVAQGLDDVVHLHLAEGMGAAVVSGGRLVQGARGLAAEIAGTPAGSLRDGQTATLFQVMEAAGVVVTGAARTIVDVSRVTEVLDRGGPRCAAILDGVATTLVGACHLLDPTSVVLGGSWGTHPVLVEGVRERLSVSPGLGVDVLVRAVEEAPLVGARLAAVADLRTALVPPA